jgi:hypothetical protein
MSAYARVLRGVHTFVRALTRFASFNLIVRRSKCWSPP